MSNIIVVKSTSKHLRYSDVDRLLGDELLMDVRGCECVFVFKLNNFGGFMKHSLLHKLFEGTTMEDGYTIDEYDPQKHATFSPYVDNIDPLDFPTTCRLITLLNNCKVATNADNINRFLWKIEK
jgi:hypothetical protein